MQCMSLGVPQNVLLLPERCPYKSCLLEFGKIYTLVPCELSGLSFCSLAIHHLEVIRNDLRNRIAKEVCAICILSFFFCQSARSITGLYFICSCADQTNDTDLYPFISFSIRDLRILHDILNVSGQRQCISASPFGEKKTRTA